MYTRRVKQSDSHHQSLPDQRYPDLENDPKPIKKSASQFGFVIKLCCFLLVVCFVQYFSFSRSKVEEITTTAPIVSNDDTVPPYLMSPPQASNGYETFEQQCLRNCLSAYEASPATKAGRKNVTARSHLREDRRYLPPPRILHFLFIGDINKDSSIRFTFTDYLMIRSAYFRLQSDEIYLHSNVPPLDSPLWELIRPMISERKHLEPITEIYGRRVTGKAHVSDIARLRVLQEYGGMYMDIDSLSLRPFSEEMWDPPSGMTMGYELQEKDHIGCGVIIARKDSMFLKRWLESYTTFDDSRWADHTVLMAGKLAREHPDEIDVLPETHFYRPSWRPGSIDLLWKERPANDINLVDFSKAYAPHYWGTFARKSGRIQRMTPHTVLHENAGIHQILRPLLPHPYFSIAVRCDVDRNSYWKIQNSLESIIKQSFPLWEIILVDSGSGSECVQYIMNEIVPKLERLHKHLPKSIRHVHVRDGQPMKDYTRGIWLVELDAGRELSETSSLENALNIFRDGDKFLWHFDGGKEIEFVYDSSKGIFRVPRPFKIPS